VYGVWHSTGQEQGWLGQDGPGPANSAGREAGLVLYIRVLLSACNRREAVGRNTSAASVCRTYYSTPGNWNGGARGRAKKTVTDCLFMLTDSENRDGARYNCEPERAICWPPRPPYRSTQGAAMSSHGTLRLVVADTTGSIASSRRIAEPSGADQPAGPLDRRARSHRWYR
jgi:hypothetical protein